MNVQWQWLPPKSTRRYARGPLCSTEQFVQVDFKLDGADFNRYTTQHQATDVVPNVVTVAAGWCECVIKLQVDDELYDLFAMVEHKGNMETVCVEQSTKSMNDLLQGHYISFVRRQGEWFKCDDSWVSSVSEQDVKDAQGYALLAVSIWLLIVRFRYLLFYCKRGIDMTVVQKLKASEI